MHLFTYGTLLFPEVWRAVVGKDHSGKDFKTTPAKLPGYQIFRVKDTLHPGIIAANSLTSDLRPLTSVPGLLYFNLDAAALARLDAFEGPEYIRESVTVICEDGRELQADAYVVPPESAHLVTNEIWTPEDFLARGHLAEFIARFSGFTRLA